MTSLAALTSSVTTHRGGRAAMDAKIAAATASGAISQTDATALGSALDSIDTTLASGTSDSGTKPASMKDRMDSLIDAQVSKGTLTSDQADELKQFFAAGPAGNGTQGVGSGDDASDALASAGTQTASAMRGPGGPGGAGGPPPGPPPSGDSDTSDSGDTSSTTATDSAQKQLDTLIGFLEKMRSSIGSQSTYDAASAATASSTGLVFSGVA